MTHGAHRAAGAPPDGVVTFLFTDVEGSTKLWDEYPDEMERALAEHDRRLHQAVDRHGGYVFTLAGDSFAVAFASADEAVAAALDAQLALRKPCGTIDVKVRMGLHTGSASVRDGDYFGTDVNRAARLMSAAHGGQIVLSDSTIALVDNERREDVEFLDKGEHRLKDLRQPQRVYELRHPELAAGFPELRTLDASAGDLPVQPTELIGRETELADVRELLDAHRLVTLTGSGGAGKTRLALHAAAESLDDHPDGVRLVELSGLTDSTIVVDEVAQRVGARPGSNDDVSVAIADQIGRRRMLLVLDNCEHVIGSVADLVSLLLRRCPELRVLTTSQVVLDVSGEFRYRVPSLGVPPDATVAAALGSGAVGLFVERARAVSPAFELTDDNVAAVTGICRRLDGIPLAIELAAARVRVLSPGQIFERLDERFRLLGGGARDVAQRQRTLRAAMDWSHDLLSEEERTLFRRESSFAGTFSLDAAEEVGSAPPIEPFDVLDLEAMLVDKSFVATEERSDGVRYRLPESIRAYGRERLAESGESVEVGRRHAEHFARVAQQLYEQRRSGDIKGAVLGLDRAEDDLRAALRYALDRGETELAAEVIGGIGHLWYTTGAFREGIAWCRELFEHDLDDLPDVLRAKTLHVYGTLLGSWEQPAAGIEIIGQEIEIRRRLGDPARLGAALNNLGNLLSDLGRPGEAAGYLRQAIKQFRLAGESASLVLSSLAWDAFIAGRIGDARALYEEALAEAVEYSADYDTALATLYLAHCSVLDRGAEHDAHDDLAAAAEIFEALGVRPGVGYVRMVEAMAMDADGERRAARERLADALHEPDAQWTHSTAYWMLVLAAGMSDEYEAAATLVGAARRWFADVQEAQPRWVLDLLDDLHTRVERELDETVLQRRLAEGDRLTRTDAIDLGRRLLRP